MEKTKYSARWPRDRPLMVGVLALLLSFAATGAVSGRPTYFGVRPFFVVSESMEPTIRKGQFVLAVPIDGSEISAGDIAVYAVSFGDSAFIKKNVIHRVVAVTPHGTVIFKGDNNRKTDPEVPLSAVRYRIVLYETPRSISFIGSGF